MDEKQDGAERANRQAGQSDAKVADPPFRRGPSSDWRIGVLYSSASSLHRHDQSIHRRFASGRASTCHYPRGIEFPPLFSLRTSSRAPRPAGLHLTLRVIASSRYSSSKKPWLENRAQTPGSRINTFGNKPPRPSHSRTQSGGFIWLQGDLVYRE